MCVHDRVSVSPPDDELYTHCNCGGMSIACHVVEQGEPVEAVGDLDRKRAMSSMKMAEVVAPTGGCHPSVTSYADRRARCALPVSIAMIVKRRRTLMRRLSIGVGRPCVRRTCSWT
jgi:hypothetical protein